MSQEYDRDRTVQYKNRKATLPKITYPDMMNICEVIDECPDDTSPVVMEDCVNNNLDEIHRDISEHDIETNLNATKMVIEKYADDHDDYEIKKHDRKQKM